MNTVRKFFAALTASVIAAALLPLGTVFAEDEIVYEVDYADPNSVSYLLDESEDFYEYVVKDDSYTYLNIFPDTAEAYYWGIGTSNLYAVTFEDGYADSFDPSAVIEGAKAYPVSMFPYSSDCCPDISNFVTWNTSLDTLPEENTRIVTGAEHQITKLYEMEGVDQVFNLKPISAARGTLSEPALIIVDDLLNENSISFFENLGIAATGITYVGKTGSSNKITRLTYTSEYEDLTSVEFLKEALDICQLLMDNEVYCAYPAYEHPFEFTEIPDGYALDEAGYDTITADENGTVYQKTEYKTYDYIVEYGEGDGDMCRYKYYLNNYLVEVTPADDESFKAEFGDKYNLDELSNGTFRVTSRGFSSDYYFTETGWYLEDAEAAARELVMSDSIASVDVCEGYWKFPYVWIYGFDFTFYSDEPLTEADFDWINDLSGDGILINADGISIEADGHQAKMTMLNSGADKWTVAKAMFHGAIENMPSVYNVGHGFMENAIAIGNTFKPIYTLYHEDIVTGDPDGSGEVNIDDAVNVLGYYAKNAAGIENVTLNQAEYADTDYSARAAEMTALAAADVNRDGRLNLDDAACILSYYANTAAGNAPDWNSITA